MAKKEEMPKRKKNPFNKGAKNVGDSKEAKKRGKFDH